MIPVFDVGAGRSYLLNHPFEVALVSLSLIALSSVLWALGRKFPQRRRLFRVACLVSLLGLAAYNYWAYSTQEVSIGEMLHSLSEDASQSITK